MQVSVPILLRDGTTTDAARDNVDAAIRTAIHSGEILELANEI